jgi:hypothetical protein
MKIRYVGWPETGNLGDIALSLAYQPKCWDFAISVGQEEFMLPLERLTAPAILSKVEHIEGNYAELTARLNAHVALYRRKLHDAASAIRSRLRAAAQKAGSGLRPAGRWSWPCITTWLS